MLKSLFSNTASSSISIWAILICSVVSIILGVMIAYAHKKTSRYSKNFLITLAVLPILVQSVMIMVNGNLGTSVAILGAFGLVRFRSMPGTSKEILSVFFAMAVGLATGMGHVVFACLMTVMVIIVILLFSKTKLFDQDESERVLKITVPENMDYNDMFEDIFSKYLKHYQMEHVKTVNMGSLFELTYRIKFNDSFNDKEFIDEIRVKNGNLKVSLSQKLDESEF